MLREHKRKTLLEDFKVGFHQYLRETTVHGFRYLIEGRNLCEIAVWIIVITFCFTLTFAGIYTSISESYKNPILTSVQTTQIQDVSYTITYEGNIYLYYMSCMFEILCDILSIFNFIGTIPSRYRSRC